MKTQNGMATLLVTVMLLVVSLLFSLASYKNVFYQIKRTQNEVLIRQAHWTAEGGLECGFALVNDLKDVDLAKTKLSSKCKVPLNLFSMNITGSGPYLLTSESNIDLAKRLLEKKFNTAGPSTSGALKSSSDLYFNGAYTISPDPNIKESATSAKWLCTILRYKGTVDVDGNVVNQGLIEAKPPYSGFPSSGQSCKSDYQSTLGSGSWTESTLSPYKDFVYDTSFDPFKDVFTVPRSDWTKVRDSKEFKLLTGSYVTTSTGNVSYKKLSGCGGGIADAIKADYDLIWVDGTCELDNNAFTAIDNAIAGNSKIDGIILVIQDGIFSVRGAHKFPGMIYHLNISFSPNEFIWNDMASHSNYPIPAGAPLNKTSYYQSGAFMPAGGYVMDAPGQIAAFASGMNFLYNRDLIEKPLTKLRKVIWVEGSWNDI
ncbi:hypothetical protein [Photobacterium nomapromontoriensis]|uniref:hypothetical protein n=1 Tax=Photobacterium nomapromontoriensis TaxID=2910237 RepID=UPI003D0F8D4F